MSEFTYTTFANDPAAFDGLEDAELDAFPEFLLHDPVWDACFPRLFDLFGGLQVVVHDSKTHEVAGLANCVSISWDGSVPSLPSGTHDVLQRGVRESGAGVVADTLVPIQAIVFPSHLGTGASRALYGALAEVALRHHLIRSITPLRPTKKAQYPLIAIEHYIAWTTDDGLPFDPWLRAQHVHGAQILGIAHDSLVIEGSVAEWERWTKLAFPASGDYVIEGGLVPLHIDLHADRGRYSEPHVWLEYTRS